MYGLQAQDILVILVVALLLFGPTRISEISRGLGGAMREFRKGISGETESKDQKPGPGSNSGTPGS
ncbi:MAG TPA: twin-arginine translocase TatA/TatE family subunit [Anaerolineae bacterium]